MFSVRTATNTKTTCNSQSEMAAEKHEKANDQPLVEQVTEFLQLQLAATKLTAIELLSLTLSYGFGVLLAIGAAMLALMFFLGAITLLIAQAIGSIEWAMIIAAIVFAIVGITLLAFAQNATMAYASAILRAMALPLETIMLPYCP